MIIFIPCNNDRVHKPLHSEILNADNILICWNVLSIQTHISCRISNNLCVIIRVICNWKLVSLKLGLNSKKGLTLSQVGHFQYSLLDGNFYVSACTQLISFLMEWHWKIGPILATQGHWLLSEPPGVPLPSTSQQKALLLVKDIFSTVSFLFSNKVEIL